MSIYRGAGGASDATDDSTVNAVAGYASAAAASATSAANSATDAATSASAASTSASSAATQVSLATAQAGSAASSASSAASSVTSAASQASAASTSAAAAASSASNASTSATAAAISATNAATSATAAAGSATTATTQATNSAASAASALAIYGNTTAMNNAVTASQTAATNAATSASSASTQASNASTSSTSASSSASSAATSATAAAASASTAASSVATIAGYSASANTAATNAANSATAAATSAAASSTSAITAATNATTSTTQANNAAASAATATTKASEASASATSADTSSVIAANSATSAGTSANNAAASASFAAATVAGFEGNTAAATSAAVAASASASAAAVSASSASTSATQAAASAAGATAIVTGVASTRPSIRPSLLLDFASTRVLDPRITFTRASTATFYDTNTSAVAEQNLLLQSQDFDNTTSWVNRSGLTTTANSLAAPNGTSTATLITLTSSTTQHYFRQGVSLSNGDYVFSVFAKAGTHPYLQLTFSGQFASFANFNVSTGIVGTTGGCTASITDAGSGWYRCTVVFTKSTATHVNFYVVSSTTSAAAETWTSLGTETVYLWGAQLEQRSTATAYTATTTQAITNYIPVLQTAASKAARFDCNPVTRESLGLLIEESRTNLLTYSSEFDNAAWVKGSSTITANNVISPEGTLTGDNLVSISGTSSGVTPNYTVALLAGAYTQTVYAKAKEVTYVKLIWNSNLNATDYAVFNLATGVVTGGSYTTASITPVGNGWYRCSITSTLLAGTFSPNYIWLSSGTLSRSSSYTGDGYSGLYIWGAQLEAGAFPTSYIPTVASQVTRAADSAVMTGTNFSSWYNQAEGTLFANGPFVTPATTNSAFFSVGSGSSVTINTYFLSATYSASGDRARILGYEGTSIVADLYPAATFTNGQFIQAAFAYAPNDFALSLNGDIPTFDTVGQFVALADKLVIGNGNSLVAYPRNGTIKRLVYYPARLSNTELQGLTA